MKNLRNFILFVVILSVSAHVYGQSQTNDSLSTDTAYQNYINNIDTTSLGSDLSLEAVAELFRTSEDLADFEKRLNDADEKINNLDLNGNGEVDYLRVVDHQDGDSHIIVIQAVIGDDAFQDVASIDLVKEGAKINMQIIGDEEIYGTSYYIEPEEQEKVESYPAVAVVFHVGYSPYYSPYHWGYYPPYYSPWHRYPPYYYHRNMYYHHHVHHHHHYHHAPHARYPHNRNSYNNRYRKSAPNHINQPRSTGNIRSQAKPQTRPNNKAQVQPKKPSQKPNTKPQLQTRPSQKPNTKPQVQARPSQKPNTRPQIQARPSQKPNTRPQTKPKIQPKPQARPQARPQPRPQARPQARPGRRRR